jgi:hypothetical protein
MVESIAMNAFQLSNCLPSVIGYYLGQKLPKKEIISSEESLYANVLIKNQETPKFCIGVSVNGLYRQLHAFTIMYFHRVYTAMKDKLQQYLVALCFEI